MIGIFIFIIMHLNVSDLIIFPEPVLSKKQTSEPKSRPSYYPFPPGARLSQR